MPPSLTDFSMPASSTVITFHHKRGRNSPVHLRQTTVLPPSDRVAGEIDVQRLSFQRVFRSDGGPAARVDRVN